MNTPVDYIPDEDDWHCSDDDGCRCHEFSDEAAFWESFDAPPYPG